MISRKTKILGWMFMFCIFASVVLSGCTDLKEFIEKGGKGVTYDTPTQTEEEKESGVPAPLWQTLADVLAIAGLSGAAIYIRNVKKVANGRQDTLEDRVKRLEEHKMKE